MIPLLMRFSGYLNLLDEPGSRKVHAVVIPRCGGLGLAVGAIVAILIYTPLQPGVLGLLLGGLVILSFGVLDDRYELSYQWKFLGQFLAVLIVIYGGICVTFIPFSDLEPASNFITIPLTVFFAIGVINAVNMSDGLDGLAAGIMLMTFATIAFLAIKVDGVVVASMALAVAGGVVGFLWFNTHPAMVFMGDTGSQYIGLMAVFLAVYLTQDINQALNPALPLLLLGLPILDTLTVMVRRIRSGRSPFSPDKTHIHHRLMEHGFTHAEAVGTIYIVQGVFLSCALFFRYASDLVVIGTYLSISASILLFFYWASKTKWRLHACDLAKDRRGLSLWRNNRLFQFCRHYINVSLALFLLSQIFCLFERVAKLPVEIYFLVFGVLLLFFLLPRAVQDVWVRFSIYISAVFADVMGREFPEMLIYTHWLMDVYLIALIVVVSIAIRITRKSKFRMTTQDVLVILFMVASILLFDVELIEHIAFKLFCLVYALEYLLHRDVFKFRLTRYAAALSGVLIMVVALPTLI